MGVSGAANCIKVFMFIANFIFWLCGCVILGFAVWAYVDPEIKNYWSWADNDPELKKIIEEYAGQIRYAAIILIVLGSVVLVIGFLGCCGAIKESQILLSAYAFILFVILGGLVGSGVYFVVQRKSVFGEFESKLNSTILYPDVQKKLDKADATTTLLTTLEKTKSLSDTLAQNTQLKCCGSINWKDYQKSGETFDQIKTTYKCTNAPDGSAMGCTKALVTAIENNINVVAYGAAGAGGLCLIGILAALCLCCSIKED